MSELPARGALLALCVAVAPPTPCVPSHSNVDTAISDVAEQVCRGTVALQSCNPLCSALSLVHGRPQRAGLAPGKVTSREIRQATNR
ncbi:hypothetical protein BCR34DRAFT_14960 [Clohesyomyces aquaticus]|uniref:Uncharacterized protein n=1 Tax=Clohesyomyces aquaticus TaxID=1231657 RepID=A0A1Y1ZCR1_9PLEO|nr:hypothetical protein BCR34DRAFT_14960 [Clohesyomyces aquaticus]